MSAAGGGGAGAASPRTDPPGPGSIRPFHFPEVSARELESGIPLRLARLSRLPVVHVTCVLPAGESGLGEDRAGLAVLAGRALEGGTEGHGGEELAEALEGIGADLSVNTGWDSTTVSVSCLADRLETAIPLLAEVLREPAFPEEEVARVRSQQVASLERRRKEPPKIAADAIARAIFRDGVPFARPLMGFEDTVRGFGPDDLRAFVANAYGPRDGGVVVVGDVEPSEIRALLGEVFGSWGGEGRGWPDVEVAPRTRERRVVVVHRPGSVQSEIRLGHVGIERGSEDYFPLLVLNSLLGGTFTSRLNQTLREEKGYTYGVRSRFAARRAPGPFTVGTAVETDVTADAVATALEEIEALVRDGPEAGEVEAARDYIAGVFPLRFETTGQLAARLAELRVYGLPDDWHARYRDRVRAVELEAVREAGRRAIRPDELAVVVVGDAERVAGPLEALDLGPVTVEEVP